MSGRCFRRAKTIFYVMKKYKEQVTLKRKHISHLLFQLFVIIGCAFTLAIFGYLERDTIFGKDRVAK
jgi:hypothetical protein